MKTNLRSDTQLKLVCSVLAVVFGSVGSAVSDEEPNGRPYGLKKRVPWTESRLLGSPDPPPPFVATRTFEHIEWKRLLYLKPEPDGRHLFVIEQGGEKDRPSRLFRIVDRADATKKAEVLSVPRRLVYGMEFHPNYTENGFIYLFSNGPTGELERANRVTRYTVHRGRKPEMRS